MKGDERSVFWTGSSGCGVTHGLAGVETRGMEMAEDWSSIRRSQPGDRSLA